MIIYKHTETDQEHIYELRSFLVFYTALLVLFSPFILAFVVIKMIGDLPPSDPLFIPSVTLIIVLWVVAWGAFIIDTAPMGFKQYMAGIRGKKITTSGSVFGGGTPKVVIQK